MTERTTPQSTIEDLGSLSLNHFFTSKQLESYYESKFLSDLTNEGKTISVNGFPMLIGMYNLIIIKSQVRMYIISGGMKPTRNWKITAIKKYFGFSGNNEKFLTFLEWVNFVLKQSSTDEV
jgi:hypothetical protein